VETLDTDALDELEDLAEELEDTDAETEDDEVEDDESVMTPKMLAKKLGINPKVLRAFLRKEFPRAPKQKNTSWHLTEAMVAKATEHFLAEEEDDESDED
jgi:hypothetical protein